MAGIIRAWLTTFVACALTIHDVFACRTLSDCNRAGECVAGKCVCDPAWTGESCQLLDLLAQDNGADSGAAWNSRSSVNSSWCITGPRTERDYLGYSPHYNSTNQTFHIFVSQMVPGCGIFTWLPGSRILHATSKTGIRGPYVYSDQLFSTFHHNPHLTRAADGTWLLYFIGRPYPEDDFNLTTCYQNTSCPSTSGFWEGGYWHGGGKCDSNSTCQASVVDDPLHETASHSKPTGVCSNGRCQCVKPYYGPHCQARYSSINMVYSKSLSGPWEKLLPDGTPFMEDDNATLHLSNPAAWPLPNGTIILAYSRAPDLGVAVAPHWKGPYTRLYLTDPKTGVKNYSLITPPDNPTPYHAEDPFIYQDKRGTWHMIFHGRGANRTSACGQAAHSTDLVHWTWQPVPIYNSYVHFKDGHVEAFQRRERPALVLDTESNPVYLLNGIEVPGPENPFHTYSYIQATSARK